MCKELSEENEPLVAIMVAQVGVDKALELLAEAHKVFAAEGVETADGARKKTAGGVWLHLVRDVVGRPAFNALCQAEHKRRKLEKKLAAAAAGTASPKADAPAEAGKKRPADEAEASPSKKAKGAAAASSPKAAGEASPRKAAAPAAAPAASPRKAVAPSSPQAKPAPTSPKSK